jgi:predicted permease
MLHSLLRDIQFALRQLRKKPGFTLITVVTLALGIGATTSIFSLVNTLVLRPLPFPEQEKLMAVSTGYQESPGQPIRPGSLSYPDYFDYRAKNRTFDDIASYHDQDVTILDARGAQHFSGEVVAANFFRTLRVAPVLGRDFNWDDEKPQANVVMLSHSLWQSQFGGQKDVVGKAVKLNGKPYTVVGVMPVGFAYPIQTPAPMLWTTLADDSYDPEGGLPSTAQRGAHFLNTIARLKSGVTLEQARADMSLIAANLMAQYPDSNTRHPAAMVRTVLEVLIGKTRPALRMLFGAVAFVLLIACVNVAGLLLARSSQRRAEVAVRSALGASRWQIIRQVLIESVVLSSLGGVLGILFSAASLATLVRIVPKELPRLDQVSIDGRVLLFAFGISVLTGLLFGVLPAWRMSRLQPAQSIRQGSRAVTADRSQHRLQNSLVIAETAIGLILLVGSGLLIRSFVQVLQVNPGFDAHHVMTAEVGLSDTNYKADSMVRFYDQLLEKISAIPGVEHASAASPVPMSNQMMRISFNIEGRPQAKGSEAAEAVAVVTSDYFATMRIPVIRGRTFTVRDRAKATPVVIVTQKFASRYFPNEDPIGKHISPGMSDGVTKGDPMREIVGVVGDVKLQGLTADYEPEYYLPYGQAVIGALSLCVRTTGDSSSVIGQIREAVSSMDSTAPVYDVRALDSNVSRSAAQARFQAVLLTSFAAMALLLFAVGLYAVLSHTVAQRTVEIGVRMALGAQRGDMLKMFLKQGLQLTVIGCVLGLAASFALSRAISSMLYGVKATDPSSFFGVPVLLGLVAFLASLIPARRAMSVDPMKALKYE